MIADSRCGAGADDRWSPLRSTGVWGIRKCFVFSEKTIFLRIQQPFIYRRGEHCSSARNAARTLGSAYTIPQKSIFEGTESAAALWQMKADVIPMRHRVQNVLAFLRDNAELRKAREEAFDFKSRPLEHCLPVFPFLLPRTCHRLCQIAHRTG